MKARGTFSTMNPGESEVFGFDFTFDLADGDSVRADIPPIWTVATASGPDLSPQSRKDGQPTITGNKTYQRISDPMGGTVYAVSAIVETLLGNTLELWAFLPCRLVGAAVG